MSQTIKCPSCGELIDVDEQIRKDIEEKVRNENNEKEKKKLENSLRKELKSPSSKFLINTHLFVYLFINQQLTSLFQHPIITLLHHPL